MQIQDAIDSVFAGEPHLVHAHSKNSFIRKKFTKNINSKNPNPLNSKSKDHDKLQIFSQRKNKNNNNEDNSFYKEFLEKITLERQNEDKNIFPNMILNENEKDNSDVPATPKRPNLKVKLLQSPTKHKSNNCSYGFTKYSAANFPNSGRPNLKGNTKDNNVNFILNNNAPITNNHSNVNTPILGNKEENNKHISPIILKRKSSNNTIKKPFLKREKSQNVIGGIKRPFNFNGEVLANKEKDINNPPKEKQTVVNFVNNNYLNGTNLSSGSSKVKEKIIAKHNPQLTSIYEAKLSPVSSKKETGREMKSESNNKCEMEYFSESKRIIDLNVNELEIKSKKKVPVINIATVWKKPNFLQVEKINRDCFPGISCELNQNSNTKFEDSSQKKDQNVINNIIIKSVVHKNKKETNTELNQLNIYNNNKSLSLTPNQKTKVFCCF